MNAEQLLTAAGDIREDFIREADPARPVKRQYIQRWAAGLAACLALLIVSSFLANQPSSGTADVPNDSLGCGMFPGTIQTIQLYWQGRAYVWVSVGDVPQDLSKWTELGSLAGTTTEAPAKDLWLYADIGAVSGTVYAPSAENPEVLYVQMTTEWFTDRWVRFVGDSRLTTPLVFYDGRLYYLPPRSLPLNDSILTLPAKYAAVGTTFLTDDPDTLPSKELAVNFSDYAGRTVYAHPRNRDTIYIETVRYNRYGSTVVYVPATRYPQRAYLS